MEQVDSFRYLSVLLWRNLSWGGHIQVTCSKARRILGLVYRRFYNSTPGGSLFQLYLSLVRLRLDYASAIWSPLHFKDKDTLENIQCFACGTATRAWESSDHDLLRLVALPKLER